MEVSCRSHLENEFHNGIIKVLLELRLGAATASSIPGYTMPDNVGGHKAHVGMTMLGVIVYPRVLRYRYRRARCTGLTLSRADLRGSGSPS